MIAIAKGQLSINFKVLKEDEANTIVDFYEIVSIRRRYSSQIFNKMLLKT